MADLSSEVPVSQVLASAASLVNSISTGLAYSNKVSTEVAKFKGLLRQGVTNLCHYSDADFWGNFGSTNNPN